MKDKNTIIKEFVDMVDRECDSDKREMEESSKLEKSYYHGICDAGEFIVEHETFQALKSCIKEDEPEKKETLSDFAYRRFEGNKPTIEDAIELISDYLEENKINEKDIKNTK